MKYYVYATGPDINKLIGIFSDDAAAPDNSLEVPIAPADGHDTWDRDGQAWVPYIANKEDWASFSTTLMGTTAGQRLLGEDFAKPCFAAFLSAVGATNAANVNTLFPICATKNSLTPEEKVEINAVIDQYMKGTLNPLT